jgi:hypothetical protein
MTRWPQLETAHFRTGSAGSRSLAARLTQSVVIAGPHDYKQTVRTKHNFCPGADHYLGTFDPNRLLKLLQSLEPEKTGLILQKNENSAAQSPESDGDISAAKTYSQHPLR